METDQMSNVIRDAILNFKGKRIERMREDVLKKIKEAGTNNTPFEEVSFLIEKKMKLDELNIRIQNKELGRDVIR
jgi:hypothetical protein